MVKVLWEDYDGIANSRECDNMWIAMALSKKLKDKANITARIVTDELEFVGAMGASTIVDKTLPNGNAYLWYKRRPEPK